MREGFRPDPLKNISMNLLQAKNKVAINKGYASWSEMYDWIARDGQLPTVVAQLIESAMEEVLKIMIL